MEASFPSFTSHPLMKLFPAHIREGANCEAMFSLLKATQDFCLEGLCWAQESCLTSPVKAGEECSVRRAGGLNSGRFLLSLNSYMKFNCLSEYFCSFMIKYIYIFLALIPDCHACRQHHIGDVMWELKLEPACTNIHSLT